MNPVLKQSFNVNTNSSNFRKSSAYLDRPRLQKMLEDAMDYPLIAVYAGSGYGKTHLIHSFLQEYDAHTTWIQISERDNDPARFWENFVQMISMSWPETGARFMEIGFPDTEEAFSKVMSLMRETSLSSGKRVRVYDDFHLLKNYVVLRFLEKAFNALAADSTVILISRTIPDINMISMMLRERVFTISENPLCFTVDEIAEYFQQLSLSVNRQDIQDIYDDTRGWAFAINLIGRSLLNDMKYQRYTLEATKANIFRLIETEIEQSVSEPLFRFLIRISLIDNHAASLIKTLAYDDVLVKEMETLNAYIRYDFQIGAYMIHHLFLDYLRQNQHLLTEEEKRDTYNKAGLWSENNNLQTYALSYYEKARDYDKIIWIIYSFNLQIRQDMARYAMEIFDRIPKDLALQNPLYPAMDIKLKMNLGLLTEASALAEQYVGDYEAYPDFPNKTRALSSIYGAWAVLRLIMSPYTHVYDFDLYFKKMREYFDKKPYNSFGPVTNQPVGAYALLVGTSRADAPEEYIESLSRAIPHSSHVLKGNFYGLDDLARGELSYYRRDTNKAEQYLKQALDKARRRGQYDIQYRALQYLMLMSFSNGDVNAANDFLRQIEALLEIKEYVIRYESYDIARSHYYFVLGQPEQIPDWLKSDFSEYAHPAFLESYANRVRAQYHFLTQQYSVLLTFLEKVRESHTLLLGKIVFKVLEALSLYQLKRRNEAISALTEAYHLAEPNNIIIPFTQYAKDMRTLTGAALKDENCSIPKQWLENINRRSSAVARRISHMILENKAVDESKEEKVLTSREMNILKDLSQGLSRSEIAASHNLSISTVKLVINTIYDKLGVTSLHDALRIAITHKII